MQRIVDSDQMCHWQFTQKFKFLCEKKF